MAGLPSRAAIPKLVLKVPGTPVEGAAGSWVMLRVKVRNTAPTTARRVAVHSTVPQGVSLAAAKVKIGRIAPGKRKAAVVRVRLDTASAAVVSISASSRKNRTPAQKVSLTATPPPPPGAVSTWHGNFTGPTNEGIGFTVSGDRRTITAWTALRVFGSCDGKTAWYPDTTFDSIPVDAAGNFVGTSSYVDTGGFNHTVRLSGTVSGTSVVNGSLAHTATRTDNAGTATCTISDAQRTWTATQG